jgi:hypothetical protein
LAVLERAEQTRYMAIGNDLIRVTIGQPVISGRKSAIAWAIIYVISACFPIAAGLSHNVDSFPRWWGAADIGMAFLLAVLTFAVVGHARGKIDWQVEQSSYSLYRILIHVIFAMFLVFFLFGDRIVWSQCLTGFAWRYWLLLYVLPSWLGAYQASPPQPSVGDRPDDSPRRSDPR